MGDVAKRIDLVALGLTAAVAAGVAAGSAAAQSGGPVITEDVRLVPIGISAGEQFGHNVAIEGETAVVGALFDGFRGSEAGSAFVFNALAGALLDRIVGTDTAADDGFSDGVAVSDGRIYIGAPENEANGRQSGRVYVFDAPSRNQIDRLDPERIVFVGENPVGAAFGWSVDAGDGFIAVGSPGDVEGANGGGGAVYIYHEQTRTRIGKFFASDAGFADNMGRRVATASGRVFAASPFDDDNGTDSGAVYMFDAATGQQLRKLIAPKGAAHDNFGLGLAADGDTLVVGAPFSDGNGASSGSVYVFDLNTGNAIGELIATDNAAGDQFGRAVAIDGDRIVVASRGADLNGSASGAVYVFDRASRRQIATLLPSDGKAGDVFGNAVAISEDRVLVGAEGNNDAGEQAGTAYLFTVDIEPCAADINGDSVADGGDFFAWVAAFGAQSPACDVNGDILCDGGDFFAWVSAFGVGCG
ncbi:MAG: GC-type dockerin domain-anchored protein [Planctomycetota bacterium]